MDSMTNSPLTPKHVKHLLPRFIFEELFSEILTPKENPSPLDSGNTRIVNGLADGVIVQGVESVDVSSTHVVPNNNQDPEKNVAAVQQMFTWAEIVKRKPSDRGNEKLIGAKAIFESTESSKKVEKPKEKELAETAVKAEATASKKKSWKNMPGNLTIKCGLGSTVTPSRYRF